MDLLDSALASARNGGAGARWFGGSGDWGARFEAFEGIGFHAVIAGSVWLLGADTEPIRMEVGDVVVIPGGAEHALSLKQIPLQSVPLLSLGPQAPRSGGFDIECLCGAYRLDHGRLHGFLRDLPSLLVVRVRDQPPELAMVIDLLTSDVRSERPGTAVSRTALIDLLLVHVLRVHERRDPVPFDVPVQRALQALHANPQQPWTVQRLSARVGLSRSGFSRLFTEQTGQSPMAYLTALRMTWAAALLTDTDAPLAVIAGRVGYSGEFAFANAFRRELGVAPGRYRRERRGLPTGDHGSQRSTRRS